jgi:hypothetical protein
LQNVGCLIELAQHQPIFSVVKAEAVGFRQFFSEQSSIPLNVTAKLISHCVGYASDFSTVMVTSAAPFSAFDPRPPLLASLPM